MPEIVIYTFEHFYHIELRIGTRMQPDYIKSVPFTTGIFEMSLNKGKYPLKKITLIETESGLLEIIKVE